jgi:hypothetical protein
MMKGKSGNPIKKRKKKLRTCNPTLPWAKQINNYSPKLGMGGLEFRKITYECWEKKLVADEVRSLCWCIFAMLVTALDSQLAVTRAFVGNF